MVEHRRVAVRTQNRGPRRRVHPSLTHNGEEMGMFYFFFFQAEDGIRDDLVTGVQTCALPICLRGMPAVMMSTSTPARSSQFELPVILASLPDSTLACSKSSALPWANFSFAGKIGRASCRGRV